MTIQEARDIFKDWQEYAEINDKLNKIFRRIPESFLLHPKSVLEEALNIIGRDYFDAGERDKSQLIKESIAGLVSYVDDRKAIESIMNDLPLKDLQLREVYLENLKIARESWADFKKKNYE